MALDTLEHLLSRIDQASEEEYSSGLSENCDAPHLENAVLVSCPVCVRVWGCELT